MYTSNTHNYKNSSWVSNIVRRSRDYVVMYIGLIRFTLVHVLLLLCTLNETYDVI